MNNKDSRLTLQGTVDVLRTQGIVTIEGVFSSKEMKMFRALLDQTIAEANRVQEYKGRPTDKLLGKSKGTVWLLSLIHI